MSDIARGESPAVEEQSDRSDLELLLAARDAALSEVREDFSAFTLAVSHDLRAPLRSMDGFSQALLDDYADRLDDEGRRHLQRIRAGAQRMTGMLDGLLGLARLAQVDVGSERVDLSEIAIALGEELEATAPARAARIEIAASLTATGNPRLLRTMLACLLDNAWKFTEGEPLAVIEVGVDTTGAEPRFFVADNGVGFDMSQAARLFTPFQRLHAAAEFPGLGIGLATAKRIVQRHGGRIWAESAPGRGTTFSFTLRSATVAVDQRPGRDA